MQHAGKPRRIFVRLVGQMHAQQALLGQRDCVVALHAADACLLTFPGEVFGKLGLNALQSGPLGRQRG